MHPRCGVLDVGVVYGDIYGVGARLNEMVESGLFFMVRYSQVLSIMPFAICYLLCRHVDASLDLFTRKSPRIWRDLLEKRALSARRLIFWVVGV